MSELLDAGDVVWVDLGETRGREQAGARPAVVVSGKAYHAISELAWVCPITRNLGAWPLKVVLGPEEPIAGAILADQIRSLDRTRRGFRKVGRISPAALQATRNIIAGITGLA